MSVISSLLQRTRRKSDDDAQSSGDLVEHLSELVEDIEEHLDVPPGDPCPPPSEPT